jgi:hypothetical protein
VSSPAVHRTDRIRDWLALSLVIAGALLYGVSHFGMGSIARDRSPTTTEQAGRGDWKMVRWNRFERMSRLGLGLVVAGASVAVLSFVTHARRRRESSHAS